VFPTIGTGELLIILLVALVVIGPKKLPAVIRTVAKTYKYIKKTAAEVTASINEAADDTKDVINDQKESLSDYFGEIEDFDDIDDIEESENKNNGKEDPKKQQSSRQQT